MKWEKKSNFVQMKSCSVDGKGGGGDGGSWDRGMCSEWFYSCDYCHYDVQQPSIWHFGLQTRQNGTSAFTSNAIKSLLLVKIKTKTEKPRMKIRVATNKAVVIRTCLVHLIRDLWARKKMCFSFFLSCMYVCMYVWGIPRKRVSMLLIKVPNREKKKLSS